MMSRFIVKLGMKNLGCEKLSRIFLISVLFANIHMFGPVPPSKTFFDSFPRLIYLGSSIYLSILQPIFESMITFYSATTLVFAFEDAPLLTRLAAGRLI